VDIRDRIKEISTEETPISHINFIYILGDYLMIKDYHSLRNLVYFFDKYTFRFIGDFIPRGQGPGEIANIGHLAVDETNRRFYASDHGKNKIFVYYPDSLFANPDYLPEEKTTMGEKSFPDKYDYLQDTLCIGVIIERLGNSKFNQSVARWNMRTGEITPLGYERLDIENRRLSFAVSTEHQLIVKAYHHYDLLTVCTLNGDLKYNIYGTNWKKSETSRRVTFYGQPAVFANRIWALYLGENTYNEDGSGGNFPTKFLVFDLEGNYLQTLETGHKIMSFLYDKDTNRMIMNMDDDIQFAYLELDEWTK
jgi:hypothetical protein